MYTLKKNSENMLNIQRLVSAYKKQLVKEINSLKSEEYQKHIFRFLVKNKIKYRNNEQGVFFDVETLELDVLHKILNMHLDFYCSKNCSYGHPTRIETNKD